METYIIKIYPHKYMDRTEQDHFAADNIAHETSIAIKDMLNAMDCVKYKDQSTNDSYEFLILNPKHAITVNVKYRIRLVFPEVSFVSVYTTLAEDTMSVKEKVIHNEIHNSNIGMRFQEEAINNLDDYDIFDGSYESSCM